MCTHSPDRVPQLTAAPKANGGGDRPQLQKDKGRQLGMLNRLRVALECFRKSLPSCPAPYGID